MEAKDITEEVVRDYLKQRGVSVEQLFSEPSLFRYTKEGFKHFTGFEMTSEGFVFLDEKNALHIEVTNMDFNQIKTLKEAIITMKYIAYVKEAKIREAKRERELEQSTDEPELER